MLLFQVHSEVDIDHDVSKRQVSVLARDGHLPYQGKRYVGVKSDPEYDRQPWDKPAYDDRESNEASDIFGTNDKRYVGALAKSGDLRFIKQRDDKRDELDTLIDELLTAEELKKIRLEALREELYKEREENDDDMVAEKRSLSSLARTGNFPFRDDQKRGNEDSRGFLSSGDNIDFFKRGISSLARNGQLPLFSYGGKRGGISSLLKNRYSYVKRSNEDFNEMLNEQYDLENKRNVASLARSFKLPNSGKRNIASIADYRKNMIGKKSLFDNWLDVDDEEKRYGTTELLQSPMAKEKRYLGAFLASNQLPYSRNPTDYETKRNIGAMARNWNLPNYNYVKRYDNENDDSRNENILKNLAASLITQNLGQSYEGKPTLGNKPGHDENKLSFVALDDQKSFAMRKKKSVNLEEQSLEEKNQKQSAHVDENKTHNDVDRIHRSKREAFDDSGMSSDEYTMPVMQNADVSEYDDLVSKSNEDQSSSRIKRYFGK